MKIGNKEILSMSLNGKAVQSMSLGNKEIWSSRIIEPSPLCFTAAYDGASVSLKTIGSPPIANTAYSRDGITWTSCTPTSSSSGCCIILDYAGDKVYFRNDITGDFAPLNCLCFQTDGTVNASGNINSMYSSTDFVNLTELTYKYCYSKLFMYCQRMLTPPVLPATILSEGCYFSLFTGCTYLSEAPELPAKTLTYKGYSCMFDSCTNLTTPPSLPATILANNCYEYMFNNCTQLLTAPALPATTLYQSCYMDMFTRCASLTTPPVLSSTSLAPACYNNMFSNSGLTSAPILPATTLYQACYMGMFSDCVNLTSPPVLNAIDLASTCYSGMFYNCTSLTSAPALPALTLYQNCYSAMFQGCTSLTTAPELPALTMASSCYINMFRGCTNLTTVPNLPATTLVNGCYSYMFANCTSLYVNESSASESSKTWQLPTENTFTNNTMQPGMFQGCLGSRTSESIACNAGSSLTFYTQNAPIPYVPNYLCFTANTAGSTIGMTSYGSFTGKTIQYSTNKTTWNTFTVGSTTITLAAAGDKVYFRGNNPSGFNSGSKYATFTMTGSISASGSVMSLIDNGTETATAIPCDYCFIALFAECKALTSLPEVPALTLTFCCYQAMFQNCTGIKLSTAKVSKYQIPYRIPTAGTGTVGSYSLDYMFTGTGGSFTATPTINTEYYLWDYNYIEPPLTFTANTSSTTISMNIYGSPTLAVNFTYSLDGTNWYAFTPGTTNILLSQAGDKVYLRGNNPNGINASLSAYYYFNIVGSASASGSIMSLIDNGTGTTSAIPNDYCFARLFYYCSNLISAPMLPATSLRQYCYAYMFYGCSGLTTTMNLPAITLAYRSYYYMFYGCSSLYVSSSSGTGYSNIWNLPTGGTFTGTQENQNGMFTGCLGSRSSNTFYPVSGTTVTYYTQNVPN